MDWTIYTHIQLSPWDIIKINTAPEEELYLEVVELDADTKRLILTDWKVRLISQWSFFLKEEEWLFIPLNE